MDPEVFKAELFKRWPNALIRLRETPTHAFEWKIQVGDDVINRSGQSFGFVIGGFEACAEVALWIRSLVPPDEELIFMVDTNSWSMPLRPDTTLADILNHHE